MASIPVGASGKKSVVVTPEIAVDFLGSDNARVLGTPFLIMLLEMTSRDTMKPFLDEGYDSVGTHVDVKHLAATPLGMSATFHAEVLEVNDRKVRFKVEAFDEREKIAEGYHERFVVHVERFAGRLMAKLRG
ncbi:MAG: thioesterase family protein [Candidatus Solibacter usitatus]|nr:thioesterase family protein [Candidatus Solibacter usitatus]